MSGWDSYSAVYGAELRAAAHEFDDHGWPVVAASPSALLLVTGTALDVFEVPAAVGRQVCAHLRDTGSVVPVAATPTGQWWFPVTPGAMLPAELRPFDRRTLELVHFFFNNLTPALLSPTTTSEAGSRALFCLGTDPPQIVELWDWTLAEGDAFDGEAHPFGTVEMLLVLEGQVAVRVGSGVRSSLVKIVIRRPSPGSK
jgi:hypothetical protein